MHTFRFTVRVLALVLAARVGSAYALSLDRMLVTDPTGDVLLSDVVVSTLGTSTGIPPFSTLTLDGPDSQQLRSLMPPSSVCRRSASWMRRVQYKACLRCWWSRGQARLRLLRCRCSPTSFQSSRLLL